MLSIKSIHTRLKEYQRAMGYDYDTMSLDEKMQALRDYNTALMMEQSELLEEVSWKPWRTPESQKPHPNQRKVALEWVDNLVFLMNQAFCLDLTAEEIEIAFEVKHAAIVDRVTSGYSIKRQNVKTGENAK